MRHPIVISVMMVVAVVVVEPEPEAEAADVFEVDEAEEEGFDAVVWQRRWQTSTRSTHPGEVDHPLDWLP